MPSNDSSDDDFGISDFQDDLIVPPMAKEATTNLEIRRNFATHCAKSLAHRAQFVKTAFKMH